METRRIISEEYWSEFIEFDSTAKTYKHNGHKFEDLAECLLTLMYDDKNIVWQPTQMTHDGNKDFKATDGDKKYWAECKNYKTKIDLKALAATLVMAEIESVNVVLFFCYSEINNNTKTKLISFSSSTNKSIYFYDGIVLDQLILKYKEHVLPRFFPKLLEDFEKKDFGKTQIAPTVLCYLERNPFFNGAATFDINELEDLQDLKVGEIIGVHLIVINNNIYNSIPCSVQLQFSNGKKLFEILDKDIKNDRFVYEYNEREIPSGKTWHKVIYLKLQRYLPIINLPKIICKANKSKKYFEFGTVTALKTIQSPFIGSGYLKQRERICKKCLDKNRLAVIFLYGSSGTGKSRMLYECSDRFLAFNYQIVNFHNLNTSNSTYMMLREIIFALYGFTDELIECIIQNDYEHLSNYDSPQYKEIFRIIKEIYNKRYDLSQVNQLEYFSLYEKMAKGKYLFVIDDIQYWPNEAVEFLKNFWEYASNMNRKCNSVIAIAANTDILYNQNTIEFLSELESNSNDYRNIISKQEILGFEDANQAYLFLKEVLGIDEDLTEFEDIKTLTYRPKYLSEIANYLLDIQAVDIVENKAVVTDKSFFKQAIKKLPASLENVISKRWELYNKNFRHNDEFYKVLICSILFLGKVDVIHEHIGVKYQKDIKNLCKFGFLKNVENENNIYIFEHDAIKNYFQKYYYNWLETAISYYNKPTSMLYNKSLEFICKIYAQEHFDIQDYENYKATDCSEEIRYKVNEQLLRSVLTNTENSGDLYSIVNDILNSTREQFGERKTEKFYQIFEELYDITSAKLTKYQYCGIKMNYAENQLKLKQTSNAILVYKSVLKRVLDDPFPESHYITAQIYNRWFVCGRVGSYTQEFLHQWNLSMKISQSYHYCDMCIENHFDKAQSLMCYPKLTADIIRHLKAGCQAYIVHKPSRLRGHYFYRNIQLCFLQKEYVGLWDKIQSYMDEISNDSSINFKLYFRIQFLIFKIMFCLMGKREYTDFEMENMLEQLNMWQMLQNKLQLYRYYYLRGKYYTKKHRWEKAYLIYRKAFENMNENLSTEEIQMQKRIICEDMLINFRKHQFPFHKFDFTYLEFLQDGNDLKKIMYLSDDEFGIFFEQYKVSALISDNETKEGYLLF